MAVLAVVVVVVVVAGSYGSKRAGSPTTCVELAPLIVEMSRDEPGPLRREILKLYEVRDREYPDETKELDCLATARWSRGPSGTVRFYLIRDDEGDGFIGYREVR